MMGEELFTVPLVELVDVGVQTVAGAALGGPAIAAIVCAVVVVVAVVAFLAWWFW